MTGRDPIRISAKQVALIHVARSRLKLDEDAYRAVLDNHGGVQHAGELTQNGFENVMRHFRNCGFEWTLKRPGFGERAGMASAAQIATIRKLWSEYVGAGDDADLNRWVERFYGVSSLRFLTSLNAGKAINGLKAMLRRRGHAA